MVYTYMEEEDCNCILENNSNCKYKHDGVFRGSILTGDEHNKTEEERAGQNMTEQNRTGQNKAEYGRTEQNKTGQSRTG